MQLRGRLGLRRLELHRGHEEHGGPGPLDRDRLLGHAAHVADVAVLVDRAGGGHDPVAGQAPAAQLVDDAERHGQAGRGPADVLRCAPSLTGKCQSCCVSGSMPRSAVGRRRPAAGVHQPLGGCGERHQLGDRGPGHEGPDVVDGRLLDAEGDGRPRVATRAARRPGRSSVGVAVPSTAVITWATFSVLAAGEPGVIPKTSAPALVAVTV